MLCFILSLASIDSLFLKEGNLFSSSTNHLNDFSPGWYYFHIKHKSFLRELNLTIKPTNLITNRWACIFLDSTQISKIISNISYQIIPERQFPEAIPLSISDDSIYLIETHEDYIPPNSENYYDNYYISNIYPQKSHFIRSVTSLPRVELFNRWTKGVVQSDHFNLQFEDGLRLVPYQPFFDQDIKGQNEIVTIIDSGIDHRHCFYNDPIHSVPFDRTDFNHRKIVRYQVISDIYDGENGHGTHVSGIISGKSICSNCSSSMYNGVAPESKIFFVDTGDEKNPVSLTQHFSFSKIVSIAKSMNSYVFSNSWGFPPYTKKVRHMFDGIAFNNQLISFVFGSGNSKHWFDIFTPADSKNVISVGNIEVNQLRKYESGYDDVFRLKSETRNESFSIKNLNFSMSLLKLISISDELMNYQNIKIIKYKESILDYNLSFVFMNLNDTEIEKCQKIEKLENKKVSILFIKLKSISLNCSNDISFPVFSISKSLNKNERVSIYTSLNYSGFNDGLSSINSFGPTKQGLLKPEIFAPGNQSTSARGANSNKPPHPCNRKGLVRKSGTSMSTPAVAGAVILLHQYFRDGFYPTGKKNLNDSLLISSALVKSILVNSASKINNMNSMSKPLLNGGFGSIHLSNSLYLTNCNKNGFRVCDLVEISSKQDIFTTIKINRVVDSSVPLKVTLCWLDPPLDSKSRMPLFADLDLYVVSPDGKIFYGNNNDFEDSHSSTERVVIDNTLFEGEYQIHIYCPKLPINQTKIKFSLAVNGPFNQTDFSANPRNLIFRQTKKCIGCNGLKCQNETGRCICNENQTGIHCKSEVHFLDLNSVHKFNLESRKPLYLYCKVPHNLSDTQIVAVHFNFVESLLVHASVGIDQVPKFGGKFLNFFVMKSNHHFQINPRENDKIKKGSLIYFNLFEATKKNPSLFVNISIQNSKEVDFIEKTKPSTPSIINVMEKKIMIKKYYMKLVSLTSLFLIIAFFFIWKMKLFNCRRVQKKLFDYERLPLL